MRAWRSARAKLAAWLGPVPGAVRGTTSPAERARALLAALVASGAVLAFLEAVAARVDLFVDPADVRSTTLATLILTLLVEWLRRRAQQDGPAPPPGPAVRDR